MSCLGRIVFRVALVVAALAVGVYAVRVAWHDANPPLKHWACTQVPTLCEHP